MHLYYFRWWYFHFTFKIPFYQTVSYFSLLGLISPPRSKNIEIYDIIYIHLIEIILLFVSFLSFYCFTHPAAHKHHSWDQPCPQLSSYRRPTLEREREWGDNWKKLVRYCMRGRVIEWKEGRDSPRSIKITHNLIKMTCTKYFLNYS